MRAEVVCVQIEISRALKQLNVTGNLIIFYGTKLRLGASIQNTAGQLELLEFLVAATTLKYIYTAQMQNENCSSVYNITGSATRIRCGYRKHAERI